MSDTLEQKTANNSEDKSWKVDVEIKEDSLLTEEQKELAKKALANAELMADMKPLNFMFSIQPKFTADVYLGFLAAIMTGNSNIVTGYWSGMDFIRHADSEDFSRFLKITGKWTKSGCVESVMENPVEQSPAEYRNYHTDRLRSCFLKRIWHGLPKESDGPKMLNTLVCLCYNWNENFEVKMKTREYVDRVKGCVSALYLSKEISKDLARRLILEVEEHYAICRCTYETYLEEREKKND